MKRKEAFCFTDGGAEVLKSKEMCTRSKPTELKDQALNQSSFPSFPHIPCYSLLGLTQEARIVKCRSIYKQIPLPSQAAVMTVFRSPV